MDLLTRFHLRSRLGDGCFRRNRIRVFTEYALQNGQRADIAIVRVERLSQLHEGYLLKDDRVLDTVAVIECKYLSGPRLEAFRRDVRKVEGLCRKVEYSDTLFYLAQLQEGIRTRNRMSVFPRTKAPVWAQGRLTELVGCWGEDGWTGGMHFGVVPHTELNNGVR